MAALLIKISGINALIEVVGSGDDYEWYATDNELLTLLLKENREMEVCDLINAEIGRIKKEAEMERQLEGMTEW